MKTRTTLYLVYVEAPPYPSKGYFVTVKFLKHWDDKFLDSLPPCLIDYVVVNANNAKEAQAIGLQQLFQKQKCAVLKWRTVNG